jgi:hypothetical protein
MARFEAIILFSLVWIFAGYQVYTVFRRDDATRGWEISNKLFGWCRLLGNPTQDEFVSHARRMTIVFFLFATLLLILALLFVD